MKEKIARFMYGRYGMDYLCRALVAVALVLLVLSMLLGSNLLYWCSLGILVYSYYRAFSRNIQARYKEAMAYEKFKKRIRELRTHKIFKCPHCQQKIRIPRHKGKIEITCQKCRTHFPGRT